MFTKLQKRFKIAHTHTIYKSQVLKPTVFVLEFEHKTQSFPFQPLSYAFPCFFFSLVNVTFSLYAPANLNRAQTVICAKLYLVCVFLFCCSLDVVIFEEKQWRVVYGQIVVGKNYMCSKFNKLIEDYAWDWTIIPKRKLIISNKRNFWAYSDYIQSTTRMCLTGVRREILFIPKKWI